MSRLYSPWRPVGLDRVDLDWPSRARPRPRCRARTTRTAAAPSSTCPPSQGSTRSLSSSLTKTSQVRSVSHRERHYGKLVMCRSQKLTLLIEIGLFVIWRT